MEHLNKNMEEFFRKSLDQFDKEPSDQLWDTLEERLDDDRRGFGFLTNWLKALVPFLLLLFAFGYTSFNKNNTIASLNKKLSSLQIQYEKLNTEIKSSNINELSSTTTFQDDNTLNPSLSLQKEYIYLYDTIVQTKYIKEYVYQNRLSPLSLPAFHLDVLDHNTSLAGLSNSESYKGYAPIQYKSDNESISLLSNVMTLSNKFNFLESNASDKDRLPALKITRHKSNKAGRKKAKLPEAPIVVVPHDPWGKPQFYYRIGVSARMIHSLKGEKFTNSALGGGFGFLQEIGLTSRFAITSGLTFNNQEYALNAEGNILPASQIQNFPEYESIGDQLIRVEVENDFIEFPLGIKYDFYLDNRKSFFINPTINWSIHDPQEFNYFLEDSRIRRVFSGKRLGYLSSINLMLGVERPINRYMAYQAGIAYEHNLIPLGIEKQNLRNFNLKFNLLFGKK